MQLNEIRKQFEGLADVFGVTAHSFEGDAGHLFWVGSTDPERVTDEDIDIMLEYEPDDFDLIEKTPFWRGVMFTVDRKGTN